MLLYFERLTQSIFWSSLASGLTFSYDLPGIFKITAVTLSLNDGGPRN